MTDDTHETGHRDGGASEPPILSRRELRRRQQEMEQNRATDGSGDSLRWVDPFPAVPRTSEGGLFGPDRVRPGSAQVATDLPETPGQQPAPAAPADDGTRAFDVVDDGTRAFDELFESDADDEGDADRDTESPGDPVSAAPVSPFDAVVAPAVASGWNLPEPPVGNAHPFRMPLTPSVDALDGETSGTATSTSASTSAGPTPADFPAAAYAARAGTAPSPAATATPASAEQIAAPVPGADPATPADQDAQRYATRAPHAETGTSSLTLFPEQTGQRPPRGPVVARQGFRGFVNTVTGGVFKIAPGPEEAAVNAEAARRAGDERVIRQATWSRAVSVLVANRKGGVGKTPTSLILGGVLGSVRGGSVAVIEVTDDPGALGYRAEGQPQRGLGELVRDRDEIHSAGQLAGYTAPQTSFASVVASVGPRRELTGDDVIGVARLIDEYYAVRVMDSGNQPSSSAFRGAIEVTDVLVVPVLNAGDAVLEAVALLDFLRALGGHAAMLADNAIIVRLHDGRPEDPAVVARIDRIIEDARPAQVFTVPYDAHIAERGPISIASLGEPALRAFTAVGAGVVQRLVHTVR